MWDKIKESLGPLWEKVSTEVHGLTFVFIITGIALLLLGGFSGQFEMGSWSIGNTQRLWMLTCGFACILLSPFLPILSGTVTRTGRQFGEKERKQAELIEKVLSTECASFQGLDFVAFVLNGKVIKWCNDARLASRLLAFKVPVEVDAQIDYYIKLSKRLHKIVDDANNRVRELNQGALFRVVLDVEKGGFFYYHFRDGCYLAAAAVDQKTMDDNSSDGEMQKLVSILTEKLVPIGEPQGTAWRFGH